MHSEICLLHQHNEAERCITLPTSNVGKVKAIIFEDTRESQRVSLSLSCFIYVRDDLMKSDPGLPTVASKLAILKDRQFGVNLALLRIVSNFIVWLFTSRAAAESNRGVGWHCYFSRRLSHWFVGIVTSADDCLVGLLALLLQQTIVSLVHFRLFFVV